MELTLYQIDAFAKKSFEGNPAAVCPLKKWLPDNVMQSIAQENNVSETAFFVRKRKDFHIRWFTPKREVDLCGHATLASAYVIFNLLDYLNEMITFKSKSGDLYVSRHKEWLVMNFPSQPPVLCEVPEEILQAFGKKPVECLKAEDYLLVFENEEDVLSADPDFELLKKLDLRGVIITSRSEKFDFVVRFFAPKFGINEDPVTGSAYTQLMPYWSPKLESAMLHAKQVSPRGGEVFCENQEDRVTIAGTAVKYLEGKINIKI